MLKKVLYNLLITLVVAATLFSLSMPSVKAASKNKTININREQIIASLIIQGKKAMKAGNIKLAESYWQQAMAIDPTIPRPTWFQPDKYIKEKKEGIEILDQNTFIKNLREMPYGKAKIELDKRLAFNPNNNKIRLVYLELAEKNDDEKEASKQRGILGIKPVPPSKFWLYFKYFMIVLIVMLIAYEAVTIAKTWQKKSKAKELPNNIRSL